MERNQNPLLMAVKTRGVGVWSATLPCHAAQVGAERQFLRTTDQIPLDVIPVEPSTFRPICRVFTGSCPTVCWWLALRLSCYLGLSGTMRTNEDFVSALGT